MNWRIYRLPGSREIWHIDAGCIRHAFDVKHWRSNVPTNDKDIGGNNVPRAWVEIQNAELHLIDGVAVFDYPGIMGEIQRTLDGNGIEVKDES
jgi:hypothetical protein